MVIVLVLLALGSFVAFINGLGRDTALSYGVFFLLTSALSLPPLLYSRCDLRFVELVGVCQMFGAALAILLTHFEVFQEGSGNLRQ